MKDYAHIIGKVTSSPWMITPDALSFMLELLNAHMDGTISQEEIRIRLQEKRQPQPDERFSRVGKIGVLPLQGPIFPKANMMTELSGATSLSQWQQDFRAMLADDNIDGILLDVDSPGGLSDIVDETASEIFASREIKPIWAIANTAANSAAYYIASQAEKLFATPSGQVGSIGTFTVHTDTSVQQEREGVKETVIKAGRFKALSYEPLSDENRAHLQDHIDDVNDGFISAVARGRGVHKKIVASDYGEGGVLTPRSALDKGMIDGIGTFDAVLSELGGSIETRPSGSVYSFPVSTTANHTGTIVTNASYDADKEHSEPGTGLGGEPEPREAPEKGDKAIEGGWRRDTPPIAKEQSAMNRDQLEALAAKLGVKFEADTSDEDLSKLVTKSIDDTISPLVEADASAKSTRNFMKDYPDQYKEWEAMRTRDRENAAKLFAGEFEKFDGQDRGASALVLDKIEEAHLKVSTRTFMVDDLHELLTSITAQDGTVLYGEKGSDRSTEPVQIRAGADTQTIRQQFADEVRRTMEEDNLDRDAAVKMVSEKNPELAVAYLNS